MSRSAVACVILAVCGLGVGRVGAAVPAGPYLGQEEPGREVAPFAVEFLGADLHSGPVFSRDGREVFWAPMEGSEQRIHTSRLTADGWSAPRTIVFPEGPAEGDGPAYRERDLIMPSGEPCLSPDGTRLYFIAQETAARDYHEDIWMSDRRDGDWGTPRPVHPRIGELGVHWQVSVAGNGNLYFAGRSAGGGGIHVAACVDGVHRAPVMLQGGVDGEHDGGTPFVAPDESYLIFARTDRSLSRRSDLYVSFRGPDGTWGEARRLAELSEPDVNELCPTVSRDGRYLFFLRNTRDGLSPFWTGAEVIDDYR